MIMEDTASQSGSNDLKHLAIVHGTIAASVPTVERLYQAAKTFVPSILGENVSPSICSPDRPTSIWSHVLCDRSRVLLPGANYRKKRGPNRC